MLPIFIQGLMNNRSFEKRIAVVTENKPKGESTSDLEVNDPSNLIILDSKIFWTRIMK